MSFISYPFLFLFFVTLLARFTFGREKNEKGYLVFLLAASLVFYASYRASYVLLLLGITAVDFYVGRKISESPDPARKKIYLLISLVSNLGLLAFYKYSDFFLDCLRDLQGVFGTNLISFHGRLNLELPLGISFFTFQSMSYTIDLYRGQLKPEKRYWRFLLFVSFFTHLVSGPIVRAKELLYQFDRRRWPRLGVCLQGFYLMVRGFFLKMVVADNLAYYLNGYWDDNHIIGGTASMALLLAFLFSCQIFADFEGYTSIARGGAYLLGFRLPVNFNHPYIATSFKEFWSRWHITLSHWIRDYLYIPLGGNRMSRGRRYANLILAMVLAGLWHGAAYTFVIWGAIHGTALVLEKILGLENLLKRLSWIRVPWFFAVQGVVLLAWVFFRARDLDQAVTLMTDLFRGRWSGGIEAQLLPGLVFALPVVLFHGWGYFREKEWVPAAGPFVKGAWCALMLYLVLSYYGENNAFIYFKF